MIQYGENVEAILNAIDIFIDKYSGNDYILKLEGKVYIEVGALEEAQEALLSMKKHDLYSLLQICIVYMGLKEYEKVIEKGEAFYKYKQMGIKDNEKIFSAIEHLIIYSKYKLGLSMEQSDLQKIDQAINYNQEKAIEHIYTHTKMNYNKPKHSLFSPNIDIRKLYDDIKMSLEGGYKYYTDYFVDNYYFEYFNAGFSGQNICDYLKVVAIYDTDNIITIHPISKSEIRHSCFVNKIDRAPIIKETTNAKIKTKSQIEKFNQRYNIK